MTTMSFGSDAADPNCPHGPPPGRHMTFANRVHWLKSYVGKVGLVMNETKESTGAVGYD